MNPADFDPVFSLCHHEGDICGFGVLHRAFTEQNDIADISNKYPVYLIDVKNGISTWENESKF